MPAAKKENSYSAKLNPKGKPCTMPNSNRNTKPRFDSLSANCYKSNKSENANAVAAAGNWMKFVEVASILVILVSYKYNFVAKVPI